MLELVNLLVLEVIEAAVLRIASCERPCCLTKVVFQIPVAGENLVPVFGVEFPGLVLIPRKLSIFSKRSLTGEAVDITNLCDNVGRNNRLDPFDRHQGIHLVGNGLVIGLNL